MLVPLNDFLHNNAIEKTPIAWTPAEQALQRQESLAQIALLVHPKNYAKSDAELALFIDASDHSVGVSLQRNGSDWKPLAFYFKKLNPAEARYSVFNGELLAIYFAVKYF